jgi:hypothetical protein
MSKLLLLEDQLPNQTFHPPPHLHATTLSNLGEIGSYIPKMPPRPLAFFLVAGSALVAAAVAFLAGATSSTVSVVSLGVVPSSTLVVLSLTAASASSAVASASGVELGMRPLVRPPSWRFRIPPRPDLAGAASSSSAGASSSAVSSSVSEASSAGSSSVAGICVSVGGRFGCGLLVVASKQAT